MAKELPYFRWYPKDAESDEKYGSMEDDELGFFHRCLNKSWMNEGIPTDPDARARLMKTPRAIADKRWEQVKKCFVPSTMFPGKLVNPRQEEERLHVMSVSVSARNSINKRYGRTTPEATAEPTFEPSPVPTFVHTDVGTNVTPTNNERDTSALARVAQRASGSGSGSVKALIPEQQRDTGKSFTGNGADWFEEVYSRHPKKKDRGIAAQYLSEVAVDPKEFDRVHLLWCSEWAKEKSSFAPSLAQWILDKGWKYPPNGHSNGTKPKPSGCPVCKVVPCECFERQLAREAALEQQ